jgi:branched-chain amino acid transport system permease protein
MGVNVTRTKVTAFVLGSMFAGAAGVMLAHFEGITSVDFFKMEVSFIILTMVVLGGTGSITGSTLAAVCLFAIPEYLRDVKDGSGVPLSVSGPGLVGAMLAIILVVAAVRRIRDSYHGKVLGRIGLVLGAIACGFVLQFLFEVVLRQVPALVALKYDVSQLRMVIFAGTLIIVMLLKPQGILGHHEFSWDWLKKTLGIGKKKEAAA